jgi:hypothetical protein
MTPYTREALAIIRAKAGTLPAEALAEHLGWRLEFLRQKCREHGIDLNRKRAVDAALIPWRPMPAPQSEAVVEISPAPAPAPASAPVRRIRTSQMNWFTVGVSPRVRQRIGLIAESRSQSMAVVATRLVLVGMASLSQPGLERRQRTGAYLNLHLTPTQMAEVDLAAIAFGIKRQEVIRRALERGLDSLRMEAAE